VDDADAGLRSTCNGVVRSRKGARTRVSRFFVNGAPGCVCVVLAGYQADGMPVRKSRVIGWLAEGSFVQGKRESVGYQRRISENISSRLRGCIPRTEPDPGDSRDGTAGAETRKRPEILRKRQARRKCLRPAEDKDEPDSDARGGYVPAGVSSRITTPEPESLSR
jgi:hypothetical protein